MNRKGLKIASTVGLSAVIVIGAVFAYGYFTRQNNQAVVDPVVSSAFSFEGVAGWHQGATNEFSMALFDDSADMGCFASVERHDGTVDVAAELKKATYAAQERGDGYTVKVTGSQEMTLHSATGDLPYTLQQSAVATPKGTDPLKAGQQFGFIQQDGFYIKIMSYCDSPNELDSALPALRAVTLQNNQRHPLD